MQFSMLSKHSGKRHSLTVGDEADPPWTPDAKDPVVESLGRKLANGLCLTSQEAKEGPHILAELSGCLNECDRPNLVFWGKGKGSRTGESLDDCLAGNGGTS